MLPLSNPRLVVPLRMIPAGIVNPGSPPRGSNNSMLLGVSENGSPSGPLIVNDTAGNERNASSSNGP